VRDSIWNIGLTVATNTVLFTSLDLGQWIADTLSLWTLPANLVAAVIATAFGLVLSGAGQVFGAASTRGLFSRLVPGREQSETRL
jgi:hypothetical protein